MDIDQNTVALVALILGGVEGRHKLAALARDVKSLQDTKLDKPLPGQPSQWARGARAGAILLALMLPLAAMANADPTLAESIATGAGIGAGFGGYGAPVGAGVALVAWFTWRRWRRNRKG